MPNSLPIIFNPMLMERLKSPIEEKRSWKLNTRSFFMLPMLAALFMFTACSEDDDPNICATKTTCKNEFPKGICIALN